MSAAPDTGGLADIPAAKDFATPEEPAQSGYIFTRGPFRGQEVAALSDGDLLSALRTCPFSFHAEREVIHAEYTRRELARKKAARAARRPRATPAEAAAKRAEKARVAETARAKAHADEEAARQKQEEFREAWRRDNPTKDEWDMQREFDQEREASRPRLHLDILLGQFPPDLREQALAIISAGHRAMAKQHHPDLGGDPAEMVRINAAADALERFLKGTEVQS